ERLGQPPRAAVVGDLCVDDQRNGRGGVKPGADLVEIGEVAYGDGFGAETAGDRGDISVREGHRIQVVVGAKVVNFCPVGGVIVDDHNQGDPVPDGRF